MDATEIKSIGTIQAGKQIVITKGEYSSFHVVATCVAARDIPVGELLTEYLREHPKQAMQYEFNTDMFVSHLLRLGYLEETEYTELFLSGYDNADDVRIDKHKGREWSYEAEEES